jgi:hypothetical protein
LTDTTKQKETAMGEQELKDILEKHRKWAKGEADGQRADLRGADLRGADLQGAYLRGADLQGAYLQGAYLQGATSGARTSRARTSGARTSRARTSRARTSSAQTSGARTSRARTSRGADLRGAYLQGAYLQGAYLQGRGPPGRDLQGIKNDFYAILETAKPEVAGLYDALMRGKIDGSTYSGECACLVGTIANVRKVDVESLEKNVDRPAETWFLNIRKGDLPQSNMIADIVREWIEEFASANSIALPSYKIMSSAEYPQAFAEAAP